MPALPDVPNVARVTLRFTYGADLDMVNRFYQKFSGTSYGDADATAYALSVATAWNAHMAALHTSTLTLTNVTTEDLTSATGSVGEWSGSHAGGVTGPALLADNALIIKQKIDRRYRGGHPRQYLGGLPATIMSTIQLIDPAQIPTWITAYTAFRAAAGSGLPAGNQPVTDVNVSYYHGFTNVLYPSGRYHVKPSLRVAPVVDPIASFDVNPKIGSQRRRNLQSA